MTVPARPQLAASAAIFQGGRVLLVRRAREPGRGRYSLPGGRVEWGETIEQAVLREVMEETGLVAELIGLAGIREVLPTPEGRGHFVVLSFAAHWRFGEVQLNDEHEAFEWLSPREAGRLPLTDGLPTILAAAQALVAP